MVISVQPGLLEADGAPGTLLYRHPEYNRTWWWREFGRVSYAGGLDYHKPVRLSIEFQYPTNLSPTRNASGQLIERDPTVAVTTETAKNKSLLFRHDREQSWEFENRKKRAYYYNFVRTVVNSLVAHATNRPATRTGDDLAVKFWGAVDAPRTQTMDAFMENGLQQAQVQGAMWAVVDIDAKLKVNPDLPYVYWVSPLDILDWEMGEDGEIQWLKQFVYAEAKREWSDKVTPKYRFRIWTRKEVTTYETDERGMGQIPVGAPIPNETGRVPFVPLFSLKDEEKLFPDGTPLAVDLCKCANHIYNLTSLLSEILYKQTFSWLAIPDKNVDTLQMGVATAFGYDGAATGGAKPEYLSPDPEQARVLIESINAAIEQARQSVGVGRGRSDASMQIQSSDAILLESEDKRSILGDISSQAQDFEARLMDMVMAFRKEGAKPKNPPSVRYATDFDLRSLQDEIDEAISLKSLGLPKEVNDEILEQLVRRKFANLPTKDLEKLVTALTAPPPVVSGLPGVPGAHGAAGDPSAITPPADPALTALAQQYISGSAKKQDMTNGA